MGRKPRNRLQLCELGLCLFTAADARLGSCLVGCDSLEEGQIPPRDLGEARGYGGEDTRCSGFHSRCGKSACL